MSGQKVPKSTSAQGKLKYQILNCVIFCRRSTLGPMYVLDFSNNPLAMTLFSTEKPATETVAEMFFQLIQTVGCCMAFSSYTISVSRYHNFALTKRVYGSIQNMELLVFIVVMPNQKISGKKSFPADAC